MYCLLDLKRAQNPILTQKHEGQNCAPVDKKHFYITCTRKSVSTVILNMKSAIDLLITLKTLKSKLSFLKSPYSVKRLTNKAQATKSCIHFQLQSYNLVHFSENIKPM